ncbi:three-Cys-motif partner protein TcmP [Patescibacteria group bacterium]|nr:three-Cys-motif partner protein TcmP [Patescibacteria group bacterium]
MAIKPIKFFKEKKSWSLAKDKILSWYLVPYLSKVKNLRKHIVIVDGFAGTGIYEDGSEGSPLIICKTIENLKSKGVRATAVLIDYDKVCYSELKKNIKEFETKEIALPFLGDFNSLTQKIVSATKDCPTFFYIDPFGIKGIEFENLKLIFEKVNKISTEILINFNYKALLREYKINTILTNKVMGGDYYREILEDDKMSDLDKEEKIIEMYKGKYREFFEYVGSFPVMYKDEQMAKYYLIFATSNFDGFKLMNDGMGKIYREFYSAGRLFQFLPSNKRDEQFLEKWILELLKNKSINRGKIKEISIKKYFLCFMESDYNQIINKLLKEEKIYSDTGKIRINDDNLLAVSS